MPESNLASVVGVLPVADHAKAVEWYQKWIGRAPDVEPMEGIAEWQLVENAWIQVTVDPGSAGRSTVVVGVKTTGSSRPRRRSIRLATRSCSCRSPTSSSAAALAKSVTGVTRSGVVLGPRLILPKCVGVRRLPVLGGRWSPGRVVPVK